LKSAREESERLLVENPAGDSQLDIFRLGVDLRFPL
jgi:hypothetical protein